MKRITYQDRNQMENRYRAKFVNSLSGFKSANLVGTKDKEGKENLAIFSSAFHLGADPALIGLISRPHSTARHTLENILQTSHYTLNHVHEGIIEQAHQSSARYEKDESEFEKVNLTSEYLGECAAPFVKESKIKMSLIFKEKIDLAINGTVLIIGEIQDVYLPQDSLSDDGHVNIELASTVAINGLDSYHGTQKLKRLSYAKTNKWPIEIS